MPDNPLDNLLAQTKVLIDAITHDDIGAMVGGQYQGGNGGLISRQTIIETDKLRRLLADFKVAQEAYEEDQRLDARAAAEYRDYARDRDEE